MKYLLKGWIIKGECPIICSFKPPFPASKADILRSFEDYSTSHLHFQLPSLPITMDFIQCSSDFSNGFKYFCPGPITPVRSCKNSLRNKKLGVQQFIAQYKIHILFLQETMIKDEIMYFPGYKYFNVPYESRKIQRGVGILIHEDLLQFQPT